MRTLRRLRLFGLALLWIGALVMQLGPHDAVDNVCHWLMSISCSAWVSDHHILRAIFWPLWLACVIWIFWAAIERWISWNHRRKAPAPAPGRPDKGAARQFIRIWRKLS